METPRDTTMSKRIRFGILGCGRITRRGLIPGITESPAAELTGLASLRPGVAAELAGTCGNSRVYDSYEALIDAPDVDAIYIPTTGDSHREWTLRAARAGKHVLCEKSLALTVAQADEMSAACNKAGVILQEAFMWRHHPRSKRVKELLNQGAIGELRLVCAHFSFNVDRSDWRLDPRRGGGAVWDIGCYGVNAARHFTGAEPESNYARADFHESGADVTMQIALGFPGKVMANIDCSFEAAYRCEVELVGTRGTITLPDAFLPPPEAKLLVRRGTEPADVAETIVFPTANQYVCQVTDFCESIGAGTLLPPAEDGVRNMRVLETALKLASYRVETPFERRMVF
ncbi:MAG: Gfo/Idh/MocA family oxidoreductase [Planctomycetaceae bacterium]|nr:Gfo/Idh/MocA family oxidoreductase [Planctomycetaceae bacterium]